MSLAMDGLDADAVRDEDDRPWIPIDGSHRLAAPFHLGEQQIFLVAQIAGEAGRRHGLFSGGERSWNNFTAFTLQDDEFRLHGETTGGGRFAGVTQAHPSVQASAPFLLSFTPGEDGTSSLRVNDAPPVSVNGDVRVHAFGAGYATHPRFLGSVGELRVYPPLTAGQIAHVATELRGLWGLAGPADAFAPGYRDAAVLLDAEAQVVHCGGLDLAWADTGADAQSRSAIFVGKAESSGSPSVRDLDAAEAVTVQSGTVWRLSVSAPAPADPPVSPESVFLRVASEQTASIRPFLGEHGFYALLYREQDSGHYTVVAESSAGEDGSVTFGPVAPRSGYYTLGLVQGITVTASPAHITLDDQPATGTVEIPAGKRLVIGCTDEADFPVHLYETDSGMTWYRGLARDMNLPWWAIRPGTIRLTAAFDSTQGYLAERQEITLQIVATDDRVLYPGLEARLIRLTDDTPATLPAADAFTPPAVAVGALPAITPEYARYPGYRTSPSATGPSRAAATVDATSVRWIFGHARTRDPGGPPADPPSYWHLLLPQPSFSMDPAEQRAWQSTIYHPLPDLNGTASAARISGLLLIDTPGLYRFHVASSLPIRVQVASSTAENQVLYDGPTDNKGRYTPALFGTDIAVKLPAGLVDFSIIIDARTPVDAALCVKWQPPGATDLAMLDGGRFLHPVSAAQDRAYLTMQEDCPWRTGAQIQPAPIDPTATDAFGEWMATLDIAALATDHAAFAAASERLYDGWQRDPHHADSTDVMRLLLALTRARMQQIQHGSTYPYGDTMVHGIWLRSVFDAAMRHPLLQRDALTTRAVWIGSKSHARAVFSEWHKGTNDGYHDHSNFLVNIWRGAEGWDDPIAYDAARSLYDNHFTYGRGSREGLQSDGLFNFHPANGRQINMRGYGTDWLARVLNQRYFGTPWGTTPEQYRRLADFVLQMEWFYYNGAKAFTASGRHNTHVGDTDPRYADRLLALPEGALDDETRSRLQAQADRLETAKPLTGNTFFYRNLLMIHRRADYYLDVKMNSPIVAGPETFAGHQPGNLSFGDGVTTILRHGDEYRNIHAYNIPESLWRFRSLPGTTQLDHEYGRLAKWRGLDRYRKGGGTSAGGVSDGDYGHCAFDFIGGGTHARKFFAFTEDGMMVLGAGITGEEDAPLFPAYSFRTNINQCEFSETLTITDGTTTTTLSADDLGRTLRIPLDRRLWVQHRDVGYIVLPTGAELGAGQPGELVIRTSMRNPINRLGPDVWKDPGYADYLALCQDLMKKDPPRQVPVLEIWIEHGKRPENASAAYFVCMRPEKRSPAEWLARPPVEILANTPDLQAVRDTDTRVLQAFFREPGTLIHGTRDLITVDHAAAVMVRPDADGDARLILQDPRAASTNDRAALADVITITLSLGETPATLSIPMPGKDDTVNRYRGGLATCTLSTTPVE